MPPTSLVFFDLSAATFALPAAAVREMVLPPRLWRPPACPAALAGVLNLRGVAVPVLRLDRLLDLPPAAGGPFAPLVVLRRPDGDWAFGTDGVRDVCAGTIAPAPEDSSFEGCVAGRVDWAGGTAHLLAPDRLLQRRELVTLRAFQDMAAQRIAEWRSA